MIGIIISIVLVVIVFSIVTHFQDKKHKAFVTVLEEECEKKSTQFIEGLKDEFSDITKILQNPLTSGIGNLLKDDGFYVIQLDNARRIIIDHIMYEYTDIIEYEVFEEEVFDTSNHISTSVTKTDMKSLIRRAVVGGVLLGGVGAIIGGATATKTTNTRILTYNGLQFLSLKIKTKKETKIIDTYKYRSYYECRTNRELWNKYIVDIENILNKVIECNSQL